MKNETLTGQRSAYRQIFKATSLFGGVQAFNILISIARSKVVAILLGPEGMGIAGLLTTTISLIAGLTNLGLRVSAVKNVAAATTADDPKRTTRVVIVLRRLVWMTGLLGALVTLAFSPWLSQLTFGNRDYTSAFAWMSVTLLLSQISSGQMVILQGMRKLQYLAQANMAGAALGLFVSIPIYYVWRIDGIVPAIILSSLFSMALSWYFARKVPIQRMEVSWQVTLATGQDMAKMGIMLSLSGLITTGTAYIVRVFIGNQGGVEQVGLYTAGFAVINTYVGMVFTAMGTDYYPRLSGIAHNNDQATNLINQQAEMAILILAPILTVFLVFVDWALLQLYSEKFLPVNGMIQWAALGMYFKATSWAIAFILLAKGASRLFFWNELIANLYILGFNLTGFKLAGLDGLGVSFFAAYIVFLLQTFLLARLKYAFAFRKAFYQVFGLQLCLGLACFAVIRGVDMPWAYLISAPLILISAIYSLYELGKRLSLRPIFGLYLEKLGVFGK